MNQTQSDSATTSQSTPAVSESTNAAGNVMNLVGSYRLVRGQELDLDAHEILPGHPMVKGKLVIEAVADGTYRIRAAVTFKGVGTRGRYDEIYRIEQQQDGFQAISVYRVLDIKLSDMMLTIHQKGANFENTTDWKRVGAEEVKDKYLERELEQQLRYLNKGTSE